MSQLPKGRLCGPMLKSQCTPLPPSLRNRQLSTNDGSNKRPKESAENIGVICCAPPQNIGVKTDETENFIYSSARVLLQSSAVFTLPATSQKTQLYNGKFVAGNATYNGLLLLLLLLVGWSQMHYERHGMVKVRLVTTVLHRKQIAGQKPKPTLYARDDVAAEGAINKRTRALT
ncbi:unnamed protein product [Ceratitis capitata]|uniref:(Mediterranean fruit fly) hypothetical protein n=1 Tax=Ceratitis capitata TaxID=7213 RepID=A0A811V080_CERCA|nr:unnamed protein product [Ceratitis capitata]